jgi:hypothetical protein
MNLSPEKLKLYERLYEEEWEAMRAGGPLPIELQDEKERQQYRHWRLEAKELPERNRRVKNYPQRVQSAPSGPQMS